MIKPLTIKQLKKACLNNRYLAVRDIWGRKYGINCKIHKFVKGLARTRTNVISYDIISFSEYIRIKLPLITKSHDKPNRKQIL